MCFKVEGISTLFRKQNKKIKWKRKAHSTRYSQAVTHPSTNRARCCLTSVIGREPVLSAWYGRGQGSIQHHSLITEAKHTLSLIITYWVQRLLAGKTHFQDYL